ncbi:MAG TPA: GAF domain-containing protein [Anaerolineales bacterium]|nr:GAF domain-containing protein [Anaerolineales bacterium]
MRAKIAGMVAAVVVGLGLTTSLVVRSNVARILERTLEAHASSVARAVASHHEDTMSPQGGPSSDRLIQAMVDTDPEGLYAIIQEGDGTVMVQASRPEAPPERLSGVSIPAGSPPVSGAVTTSVGRVYEAVLPLAGTDLFARVGLSARRVDEEIASMTRSLVLVVATALVLAVSVSLGLTQLLTRPILALQRAVRETSLGNLPRKAETVWDDEIGELAHAFNVMTSGLARSRDALMTQNRELAVLNATARAIGGSLDLEQFLRAALKAILEEMDLKAGWVVLQHDGSESASGHAGPDRGEGRDSPWPLNLVVSSGLSRRFAEEEGSRAWDGCVCLDVLASGQCMVIDDLRAGCLRLSEEARQREGLVSHASIPLVARDQVVGVLNVAADAPREFPAAELHLLSSIGRQIGVAVDNSRLWDQVQRKDHLRGQLLERTLRAQEDERRRIALELHDQVGSALASLGLGLRVLENDLPPSRATVQQFRSLRDQLDTIARDLHQLAFDLRPAALDRLGLADALEQTVHNFARQNGLAADFQAIGLDGEHLPYEVETALYRIIQEALTNVARHAQATEVGVVLERRSDSVVAVIEDNGRGFDTQEALAPGAVRLGLFGMQERAALVGGRWDIESSHGKGATIFVEVPVEHGAMEASRRS